MVGQPVAVGSRADAAEFRQDLLGRLGLGIDAGDQDIERAYNALVEFLEQAPHGVGSWAAARTMDVELAFALLSGPDIDLTSAAPILGTAPDEPHEPFPPRWSAPTAPASRRPRRAHLVWAIVALLVVAAGVLVYKMGASDVPGMSGTPTNSQPTAAAAADSGPPAVPVDPAKVAALTAKVALNAKDVASLQGLGDLYFAAKDYKNAAVWEQKILDVDAKNQVALLALGAAQYNQGNVAGAKNQWLVAAGLYPKNAEVHYDLGYAYLSLGDKVKMTAEWNKVIAIDPNSAMAKSVVTHLKPSPTPSGHPTAK